MSILLVGTTTLSFGATGQGEAMYKRDFAIGGCVQNFDIFGYDAGANKFACMITGVSNQSGQGWFDLSVYNSSTKTFKKVGNTVKTINGKNIQSHANNVDVVKYNGAYYLLFVSGSRTTASIKCVKLKVNTNSSNQITGWGFDESSVHSISLFPDYNGAPIVQSFITSSTNYICIATSYGSSIKTDTERYHIYKKSSLMSKLVAGNCTQLSLNSCRYGTGMFKTGSLGLNVTKAAAVIQCIEMDEKDDNTVILFGAIDERGTREKHQINRVYLTLDKKSPLTAKDLSKSHSYYSKVLSLKDGTKTINMNKYTAVSERFELEGLKHITGLSAYGISNGWYMSVNNSKFYNDTANPWNFRIYKAPTGNVIVYKK